MTIQLNPQYAFGTSLIFGQTGSGGGGWALERVDFGAYVGNIRTK